MTLSTKTLPGLSPRVRRSNYIRRHVKPGIVHIGVGGFHRAHQAVYVDDLLEKEPSTNWGICGVGLLPGDERVYTVLKNQDCLYTVIFRHPDGRTEARVVGSIVDYLFAPENPEAVLERLAAAETRIVTLTITEGGYNFNQATGAFIDDHTAIRYDLKHPLAPRTVFGYLTEALLRRKERNIPPFTIASCDNVQQNGWITRRMLLSFAGLRDADLCDWIAKNVAFPNSMVDRITPVTTDADRDMVRQTFGYSDAWPVVCEPFIQWVMEDHFCNDRPPLDTVGVQFVSEVEPYEKMKMRLLNGSHQALGYLGYLAGYTYVHEAATDPDFRRFIHRFMDEEVTPTLDPVPGVDLASYKKSVIDRFGNAYIKDRLTRICEYTSDRIPKFVLPSIHEAIESGRDAKLGALILASWCRYAEGLDEKNRPIPVNDPLGDTLHSKAIASRSDRLSFLSIDSIFGDLINTKRFTDDYIEALTSLYENGARETLRRWIVDTP